MRSHPEIRLSEGVIPAKKASLSNEELAQMAVEQVVGTGVGGATGAAAGFAAGLAGAAIGHFGPLPAILTGFAVGAVATIKQSGLPLKG